MSSLESFCYKGFPGNSYGTKFFVRLREVSALEDVRFREVPLYATQNKIKSQLYWTIYTET